MIETTAGQAQAAADARRQALQEYLDYRRDGGENHSPEGQLCCYFGQALQVGQTGEIEQGIQELIKDPDYGEAWKPLVNALQAILQGNRDLALANDPDLHFHEAAEIIILLENLGTAGATTR
jgi:hypothetical protein